MFLRKLRKHFWRNFPVHLSFCFQDMRNLRFAHKQENHSRRIVYDKLMVMNTFTTECRLLFLIAYAYRLFFLWLRMEVILFISSICMYMLQYFLCFVQLTLKTSLGYWYKEWIKAKVKCTLYICTLKLPTKYKTFIITLLHYVTLAIVTKIFFKE